MATEDNPNLNLNAARPDKFFLRLGNIPSASLLTPSESTDLDKMKFKQDDKDFFHLALKTAQLPGIALGETKIETMFAPLADTDMKFTFDSFTTTLRMDSNYLLYKMLILWILLIKHPETGSQDGMGNTFENTAVTGSLNLLNNFNEVVLSIELYELRPLAIPTIDLDYANEGAELVLPIQWSYSYFLPKTGNGQDYSLITT